MDIYLLLLVFLLGGLVGVILAQLRQQKRLEKQWEIERRYETMLWKQLGQCEKLIQYNNTLVTDNVDLRQEYLALQRTHE